VILVRVLAAVVVGALIGFERTFHGRPAGFRTHALVCVASSLLMLVTVYQNQWMTIVPLDAIRTDPTRMAQGIMTGIGFLGAGVIFKEGLTVRGLTTAASIWVTAAIGILLGIGFYFAATLGAAATVAILAAFRFVSPSCRKCSNSVSTRWATEAGPRRSIGGAWPRRCPVPPS
jgi:putative Mg2+ transporter-C (MgtC) family protein